MSNSALPFSSEPTLGAHRYTRLLVDRSLRFKLILACLVVTILSISAVAYFATRATQSALTKQVGDGIHSLAVLNGLGATFRLPICLRSTLRAASSHRWLNG